MSIVTSVVEIDQVVDGVGNRFLVSRHTDHLGQSYHVKSFASVGVSSAGILAQQAAELADVLAAREYLQVTQ